MLADELFLFILKTTVETVCFQTSVHFHLLTLLLPYKWSCYPFSYHITNYRSTLFYLFVAHTDPVGTPQILTRACVVARTRARVVASCVYTLHTLNKLT